MSMKKYVVTALYKFVTLNEFKSLQAPLMDCMQTHHIRGTLLLAQEGINGTVAGSPEAIHALYAWFNQYPWFHGLSHKESYTDKMPFNRAKVKLKKEIVTLGVEGIDPTLSVGTYVKPKDWNALIASEDVLVIDTRNDYEVKVGTFKHALNPHTQTFREFPEYVKSTLMDKKDKKIAMFCTGGIRCEKSTAYLKQQGFEHVYHLEGGILKYLEEVPAAESLWDGECFVFDERVTVGHDLAPGRYEQCHACRRPIDDHAKASSAYVPGVSCPFCIDRQTDDQRARYAERERQNALSKARGETHIGGDVPLIIQQKRLLKKEKKRAQSLHTG